MTASIIRKVKGLNRKTPLILFLTALLIIVPLAGLACGGEEAGLKAAFTATPTSAVAPITVQFTDQSTGDVTAYAWDLDGDGTVDSTDKNPSFTYNEVGLYTVILNITGPDGSDTEAKARYISATAVKYDKLTLTLTTGFSSQETSGKLALELADLIESRTGGAVKVLTYSDGALFNFAEEPDAIKTGAIDIVVGHPRFLIRSSNPELDIFGGASRLVVSLAHGQAIIDDGRLPALVADGFDKLGIKFLGYATTFLMSGMFNTVRETPAYHPDYMKGLKLVVARPGPLEPLDAYCEFVGVPVSSTERTLALSQGIVEATASPLNQAVALGWHKGIVKHLVATSVFSPLMMVMNGDKWDSLQPELQALFTDVIIPEAQQWALDAASDESKTALKTLAQSLDTIHYEVPQDSLALWNILFERKDQQARLAAYPKSTLDIIYQLRTPDVLKIDPESIEILEYAGIPVPSEAGIYH